MRHIPIIKNPALNTASSQPKLLTVTSAMLPVLISIFRNIERQDPYMLSPAYFAMTGRNGLWAYGDGETMMMLARHPNDPDKLLMFPPIGADPTGLLNSIISEPNLPIGELQMARLGPEDTHLESVIKHLGLSTPLTEDVLDWAYPVHVLDTTSIQERLGPKFRDFRQNVNRAFGRGMWSEPIDISNPKHFETVRRITEKWANDRTDFSHDDLTEPTEAALDLMRTGKLPLQGLLIHEGAQPSGFIIWEETDPVRGIANSIAALSVGGKGTDEFAMLKMSEHLHAKGFREVCIGGSETLGLDAFKRKMMPVRSVALSSAYSNHAIKRISYLEEGCKNNLVGEGSRTRPILQVNS